MLCAPPPAPVHLHDSPKIIATFYKYQRQGTKRQSGLHSFNYLPWSLSIHYGVGQPIPYLVIAKVSKSDDSSHRQDHADEDDGPETAPPAALHPFDFVNPLA